MRKDEGMQSYEISGVIYDEDTENLNHALFSLLNEANATFVSIILNTGEEVRVPIEVTKVTG